MVPTFLMLDSPNRCAMNLKLNSQFRLQLSFKKFSTNKFHLIIRKFMTRSPFSQGFLPQNSITVPHILAVSTPLKIFNTIVIFPAILVVYLLKIVRIWNISRRNQLMDSKSFSFTLTFELYIDIPTKIKRFHPPTVVLSFRFIIPTHPRFRITPNLAIFSNSIQTLPFFYIFHCFFNNEARPLGRSRTSLSPSY